MRIRFDTRNLQYIFLVRFPRQIKVLLTVDVEAGLGC